jgi:hypothetical protein
VGIFNASKGTPRGRRRDAEKNLLETLRLCVSPAPRRSAGQVCASLAHWREPPVPRRQPAPAPPFGPGVQAGRAALRLFLWPPGEIPAFLQQAHPANGCIRCSERSERLAHLRELC